MEECIFCRIIRGEVPSEKIYQDDKLVAIMDIFPIATGHTLVMPLEHYQTLTEIPDEVLSHLMQKIKIICSAVMDAVGAEGFNIIQNNKRVAGQVVPHAHFHIIPRKSADGVEFGWPAKKASPQEISEIASKIKSSLQNLL